ncbi:MAG: TonB-dependent receptor [Bryobacter sp.]
MRLSFLLFAIPLFAQFSGDAPPGAKVELLSPAGQVIATTTADANGKYKFDVEGAAVRIEGQKITVTARRGAVEEAGEALLLANVVSADKIAERPGLTLGNALEGETGILVQQTTTAQVSPFLRGLTGYQVLNLIDGVRFNNSTFRSGPNQYLAYVEPSQANRLEATLGPSGVPYGSDSMGGTIQVLTEPARFDGGIHGELSLGGATADLSGRGMGRVGISSERSFFLLGASGARHQDLRAGGGYDSRSVYRRLYGLSNERIQDLVGERLQDTGFRQYGVEAKAAFRPTDRDLFSVNYLRGEQDLVRNYKDLNGGLGRLISTLEPQTLDFLYGRYERQKLGWLDTLSGTWSLNRQTDGGTRQNLCATDAITRDFVRVNSFGYSGLATAHLGRWAGLSFGGDIYDEFVDSTRTVNGAAARALYPPDSRYTSTATFVQSYLQPLRRLRANVGLRWTGINYAQRWYRDVTFESSLRYDLVGPLSVFGTISRGFRAPNLNDLGSLGLNDLGYEIPAAEAIPAGALLATSAGENALSQGRALEALGAETLLNYEFGFRFKTRDTLFRIQGYDSELSDPIVRRTVLFPANNVPTSLAGLPVTVIPPTPQQAAQGVVTVATQFDPRAVKAFVNDGASRYYGLETMFESRFASRWMVAANYSYIRGRDLNPNRNIRRLPPQLGALRLRYMMPGRRPWMEAAMEAAGRQDRLSGGDRDDERIGASFRRSDIAGFFNGSRALPIGESLQQIQDRWLPIGATINGVLVVNDNTRVPLYSATAGWAAFHVRAGIPIGEKLDAIVALENIFDQNYRIHGSGNDAPGRNFYLRLRYRF